MNQAKSVIVIKESSEIDVEDLAGSIFDRRGERFG